MAAVASFVSSTEEFDLTFSFSVGGWFHIYHFGAAQAIVDSGIIEKMLSEGKRVRFCGSSAGSLVAVSLASRSYRFKECRDFVVMCGEHYRSSWRHLFCMGSYLRESLNLFGAHMENLERKPDLYKMLNDGSLEIFVTTLPNMKSKVLRQFFSYDDIIEALSASCCMAPLVGVPFRLRCTGEWVCDGGLTTIIPHIGEAKTITVSPFYFSSAVIHPSVYVPAWWGLRPPDSVSYRNLFSLGYNDMIEGLVANGYITEEKRGSLLTPEEQFPLQDNALLRLLSYLLSWFIGLLFTPFVVSCIYLELGFMCVLCFLRGFLRSDRKSFGKLYDAIRSIVSLRTLGRLLFGENVPHNRQRLERSSCLYRFFCPILLCGRKSSFRTGTMKNCISSHSTIARGG